MSFYLEGYDAYQSNKGAIHCPYRRLTAAYDYWHKGWAAALFEILRK